MMSALQGRAAFAVRVVNHKILAEEAERFAAGAPTWCASAWLASARQAVQQRKRGDPMPAVLLRICDVLAWSASRGKLTVPFGSIARHAGCCIGTVRRAIRWIEDAELLDTVHTLDRVGDRLTRGPDLYLLCSERADGQLPAAVTP